MEKQCPICNALQSVAVHCLYCDGVLADAGPLEDYRGPYSPYMDIDSLQDCHPDSQCVHLLICQSCGRDTRAAWELVTI